MTEFAAAYLTGACMSLSFMWWGWKDADDSVSLLVMGIVLWPVWLWLALDEEWD